MSSAVDNHFYASRSKLRRLILKISIEYDRFPTELILKGVRCPELGSSKHGSGAFADVFCGTYGELKVALKCLRDYSGATDADAVIMKKVTL